MVMTKLIEPGLNVVLEGIFLSCIVHCLQQKQPNQNTLFARVFIAPGQVGQEEGFCSVKYSISQSEWQPNS